STFPADLLLEANRKLAARLADPRHKDVASTPFASSNGSPETAPNRTLLSNRRRRFRPPVLAAVLAALAILLIGVVTQRAALANIASSLLQIVVTFNDEPLSDSQQQAFDELVEITETVDENGDQVVIVNVEADQMPQEFSDGVLEVVISGDESSEAVSSNSDLIMMVGGATVFSDSSVNLNLDSLRIALAVRDSLHAAKIGSPSPNVTEDQSWGDIKRAAGSTTDDSP
ncbi:MAG: hypothetical protein OXH81_06235, partial [Gemmatimonadetes bacterium]|nr:hypothetical protein [Gemmatimonadota bacterium]